MLLTHPSMEVITQPSMKNITQPSMEEITRNSEKILCDEINKDENENFQQKLIPTLPVYDDADKQEKNRKISLVKPKHNGETHIRYIEQRKEKEFVLIASEVIEKVDFEDKVDYKSTEMSYSFVDNNLNIISATGQNNITQNLSDDQVQSYNNKKYNTLKTNQETSFCKKVVFIDNKSPFTNARQSMMDNTSSSVISADEVVKRITDRSLNISSPYPLDAEQLHLPQLPFLQETLGEEEWVSKHFKKQFTLKETETDLDASPIVHPVQNVPVLTVGEIRAKVEQIVSLKNISYTNKNKIAELKQIEKEHYKLFIQQLAYKKTQEELKDLVEVLSDVGYLTTKLGELSGELKYYTDAAVFYQYVITILNEKLTTESKNSFIRQELTNPYQKLTDIQKLIFTAINGDQVKMPVVSEEATSNKKILSELRHRADLKMKMIEMNYRKQVNADQQEEKQKFQALYVKIAKALFEETANVMQQLLSKLYSDSEKELTVPPPCKYAVIGLGSMALKQMTPYSDLEFAILIENEGQDECEGSKIKQYFKNLSYLVNFKIINLGETIIPTSKYEVDMSHLVHRGVNFDLGGKTPLGRIEGDKHYDLIKTIDWMLYYVRNEQDKASKIDKNLPYILEKVCYVHGDKELVKEYQDKVTEFLHSKNDQQGRFNYETRAIKLLTENVVEINYTKQTLSLNSKKGDLEKLNPKLSDYGKGRLFDVKQEIYRLPDRMVYNLGMYYGIEGDSAWDTINKLEDKQVITTEAAKNLKNAVTFATTLRLKTYLHHKAQTEDMSIFVRPAETDSELKAQARQIFHLSEEDLGEQGRLFQYYYTALPLHKRLNKFCKQYQTLDNTSKKTFFQDNRFYSDDNVIKGFIHNRLAQYKKAQCNLEKALGLSEKKKNFYLRITLGNIYDILGNRDKAIEHFQHCLDMSKLIYKDQAQPLVAIFLNRLGFMYSEKGQYDKAIKYLTESLKIKKLINKNEPCIEVARTLDNLGKVYYKKRQDDMAIEYYNQSLEMKKLIYKNEPHSSVAYSYNSLGNVYQNKGHYDKAIAYLTKSSEIYQLFYKEEPNPEVADFLDNLGSAYVKKLQYDKAIEYYTQSLEMMKLFYKDEPHPSVANSLLNQGNVYNWKAQYDKTIECYSQSLEILKLIYNDEPHPDVALTLNNLGLVYVSKGQYDKAKECFTKTLDIQKPIYKKEPHPDVAGCLNNLGLVYVNERQHDKAIEYFTKSLEMMKNIYKDEPHSDIALTLNNLGNVYECKGQHDQAEEYLTKSLEMKKVIYKNEPHPDVAFTLNNLGNVYESKGQHDQAKEYLTKSLEMKKVIYKKEPHPDVISSLKNLANFYYKKGQHDQAIEYYTQSLEIMKLIYKNEPHLDVALTLNNLGKVYYEKRLDDQAIEIHNQCLEMKKLIYKDEPHPSIADSYYSLGNIYQSKGQYDKAKEYLTKGSETYQLFYKEKPNPDVAGCLDNLGNPYVKKLQYDKA